MNSSPGMVVIGARSVRQGTGPFIAAGLARAGANVAGVVGTSQRTAAEAVTTLRNDWDIETTGYDNLKTALEQVRPVAVAICSPWRFHARQLQQVARAGCHCLVEKPLAWPASLTEIETLLASFRERNLLLQQVAQWPTTLPAFRQLHGALPQRVDRFSMRLSPISIGEDMITDSAPHFISLLQSLAGPGDCVDVGIEQTPQQLTLHCHYQHQAGTIESSLVLQTCEQRPRPAWYAINGLRADRQVQLPHYQQSLTSDNLSVDFDDPLHVVTAQFLADLSAGTPTAIAPLLSAHRNLQQLATAWR